MLSGDNSNTDQASISQLTIQESWISGSHKSNLKLVLPGNESGLFSQGSLSVEGTFSENFLCNRTLLNLLNWLMLLCGLLAWKWM